MIEYDFAHRPPLFVDELVHILHYRNLILLIANGGILRNRYKRSMLGIVWMLLNPLLQAIVLTVTFGSLLKSALLYYPIYLLRGLLAWSLMAQTTRYLMGVMASDGGLLKRIYIPRTTYVVAVIGNGLINLLISVLPLGIIVLVFQQPVSISWLFLTVSILILAVFLLTKNGCDSDKIPLGTDLGQFYPRTVQHSPQPIVLTLVQHGIPRRGIPSAITALAQVKPTRPDAEIVLFDDRFLDQQAIPLRNERLIVRQDRLAKPYSQVNVFLNDSDFRSFGRCVLEATACGAACCVLTDVDGVLEYSWRGGNTLLVPPGQSKRPADTILWRLSDAKLEQRLSSHNLETVTQFCRRREARDTLAWIENILAAGTTA